MAILARGKPSRFSLLFAGVLSLLQGCVSAEAFRALEQSSRIQELEIARIRKERDALAEEHRKEAGAVRADLAEVRADLVDLRTEVQQLRGQVSERAFQDEAAARSGGAVEESLVLQVGHLQREVRSVQSRVDRLEASVGLKRQEAESRAARPPKAAAAPLPEPARQGGGGAGSPAPEEAYEAAYRLFKAEKYQNAREAFRRFMETYPESPLTANALFWIGETHYRADDFPAAILVYQQVLDQFPKGSKVPDSMLKMGYALEKIGETKAAVAILNRLVKERPESRQAEWAGSKIRQLTAADTDGKRDRGHEAEPNPQGAAPQDPPQ